MISKCTKTVKSIMGMRMWEQKSLTLFRRVVFSIFVFRDCYGSAYAKHFFLRTEVSESSGEEVGMASRQVSGKDNESSGLGNRRWVWRPVRSWVRITRARVEGRGGGYGVPSGLGEG